MKHTADKPSVDAIKNKNIEFYYLDSMNTIKHKTFVNIDYGEDDKLSQYLQFIHIHVTARNLPSKKKRRKASKFKPLHYPLHISEFMKTDCVYPIRSKKDKLMFDGIFYMKVQYKKKNILKLLTNGIIRKYCYYQFPPVLNDLIFKYYDNMDHFKNCINPKKYLYNLFTTKYIHQPCTRLDTVRNWLHDMKIVEYQMDTDAHDADTEYDTDCADECDGDSISVCSSTECISDGNGIRNSMSEDIFDDFEDISWVCDDCGWNSFDDGGCLVNKYDYDYKNKRSKDMIKSKKIKKSCEYKHNKYSKTRKYSKYKYSYVNIGDFKYKIKSKRYCGDKAKYPKKEYLKRKFKQISKSRKDSKRNEHVAPNCVVKITKYDRNDLSATYWVQQDYNFV